MKDLGYLNGWYDNPPQEYKNCKDKGHKTEQKTIGRCLNEYTCKECDIKYTVDSGD
jgi:hypothetical protein